MQKSSGAERMVEQDLTSIRPPVALIGPLRRWYLDHVEEVVKSHASELRSGHYREWRDEDAETFLGPWDGDDIPPRFRLEKLCCALIGTDANARLVLALSPSASRVDSEGNVEPSPIAGAAKAMACDILAAARRQGIRAPREASAERPRARGAGRSLLRLDAGCGTRRPPTIRLPTSGSLRTVGSS